MHFSLDFLWKPEKSAIRQNEADILLEIFHTDYGAMVYDTPGFTSFDVLEADEAELQHYYPDIMEYAGNCKYDNCVHIKEPKCGVLKAVEEGKINQSRYDSYKSQIEEIRNRKKY